MRRTLDALRSGDWITRERIRLVAIALLVASVAGLLVLVLTAHNGIDVQGRPLGTDFSNVYAAGTYVRDGHPEAPFDPVQQFARERALFGETTQFYGWHYPPYFLFVAAALATMPYQLALAVWQAASLGLYLLMIAAMPFSAARAPRKSEILLLALAFPAVFINIGHGQNGFLTAALLGGALLMLRERPALAGMLFGLLAYKPQFGLMIPLALLAGGYWRCFIAAAVTVALATLVTTLAFGTHIWAAFIASTEFSRTVVLEQGNTGWYKIQSVFSWARMWGAPIALAYAAQAAVTAAIAFAVVRLWRSAAPFALKGAALCLAAILATPYSLDYDLVVLAPAIAFLALDGIEHGFAPWEKTALAALWLSPLITRSVAQATLIPLGVPAMLTMFVLIVRRADRCDVFPMTCLRSSPTIPKAGSGTPRGHDIAAFRS